MDININASKKFNVDFNTIIILYRHYKDYLLPIFVILGSFLVFLLIVIPQVQQYFVSKQELELETQKLQVLKNNYNFLASLDQSEEETQLNTLSTALPPGKDFAGVINAISASSANTGVLVGDFDFQVGDLSLVSQGVSAYPSLQITVNLTGNALSLATFMSQLYKTVPLSEVTSIKVNQTASVLTILFYYKPFSGVNINNETPIIPLSQKEQSLVSDILQWDSNTSISSLISPTSSSSGASAPAAGSNPSPF